LFASRRRLLGSNSGPGRKWNKFVLWLICLVWQMFILNVTLHLSLTAYLLSLILSKSYYNLFHARNSSHPCLALKKFLYKAAIVLTLFFFFWSLSRKWLLIILLIQRTMEFTRFCSFITILTFCYKLNLNSAMKLKNQLKSLTIRERPNEQIKDSCDLLSNRHNQLELTTDLLNLFHWNLCPIKAGFLVHKHKLMQHLMQIQQDIHN